MAHTSYKINHSFDCNDKCLTYLLTFKTCLKQHVGSNTIVSDIVATTINVMTENMQEVRLICKNIFFNILIVMGIMGSYMKFQLHWSTKLMQKILLNESITSDIPSKRWHLMVLMLKMISKSQFITCTYILLVPCTDLLLTIVILVIIVVIL